MPCPSSALPVKMVARPSARCGSRIRGRDWSSGCPAGRARVRARPGSSASRRRVTARSERTCSRSEKASTSAPVPNRTRRRVNGKGVALGHQPVLSASAAPAGLHQRRRRAGSRRGCAYACRSGRGWAPYARGSRSSEAAGSRLQQRLRPHHHAGDAVAALRRLLGDEGLLHRAGRLDRAEPLDRRRPRGPPAAAAASRRKTRPRRPPAPCRRRTGRGRSRTWRRAARARPAGRRAAACRGRPRRSTGRPLTVKADHDVSSLRGLAGALDAVPSEPELGVASARADVRDELAGSLQAGWSLKVARR